LLRGATAPTALPFALIFRDAEAVGFAPLATVPLMRYAPSNRNPYDHRRADRAPDAADAQRVGRRRERGRDLSR
jgi:hypothetical protein